MNNTIEILTNQQTETDTLLARCGHRRTECGLRGNKRVRQLVASRRYAAGMEFLAGIHTEILEKNPAAFMDTTEAIDFLRGKDKHVDDEFDNSPCPIEQMADLEGIADAAGIMERAMKLANGNVRKLADVLEAQDKSRSKWAGKGNGYDKRKPAAVEVETAG